MRSTAPRSRTTVVSSPACAFSKVPRKVEDLRYVLGHALGYGLIWRRLSGIGLYTSPALFPTRSEVPLPGGMLPAPTFERRGLRPASLSQCPQEIQSARRRSAHRAHLPGRQPPECHKPEPPLQPENWFLRPGLQRQGSVPPPPIFVCGRRRSRRENDDRPSSGNGSLLRNSFDGWDSRMRCLPEIMADRRRSRRLGQDGTLSPDKFVPSPEHTFPFYSRDGIARAKYRFRLLAQCARMSDRPWPEIETRKPGTFSVCPAEMRLPDTNSGANAW